MYNSKIQIKLVGIASKSEYYVKLRFFDVDRICIHISIKCSLNFLFDNRLPLRGRYKVFTEDDDACPICPLTRRYLPSAM